MEICFFFFFFFAKVINLKRVQDVLDPFSLQNAFDLCQQEVVNMRIIFGFFKQ
jgi:hypothetical protein